MRNITLTILLLTATCPAALLAQVGGNLPPMGWTAEVMPPFGGTSSGPMVELIGFQAEPIERSVELNWQVAAERDVAVYKVDRSLDALVWEEVANITAQGNAFEPQHYSHHDHPKLPGTLYYRLRSVAEQGTQRFGPVVPVWFQPRQEELLLWPNPARDDLNVVQSERHEPLYYRIYDRTGHVLGEGWLTPEDRRVDVRLLPTGMHSLALTNSRGLPMGNALWLKE